MIRPPRASRFHASLSGVFNVSRRDSPASQIASRPLAWPWKSWLLVVLATLSLRGVVIGVTPDAFTGDPDAYRTIALTLEQSGTFGLTGPTGETRAIAFRPPLYPWLISRLIVDGKLPIAVIGGLHLLLAALTATFGFLATDRLATKYGVGARKATGLAIVAALLMAIDPILVRQSTEVMTETLAACLASLVIWLWTLVEPPCPRPSTIGLRDAVLVSALGIALAMAYLCRPTFLVWAAMLIAAIALHERSWTGWVRAGFVAAIVAMAVLGWTERNRRAIGHPVWATTHGGYTLLLANNESFYDYLHQRRWGRPWDADQFLHAYSHRYQGDPRTAAFWDRHWDGPPTYDPSATEYSDDRLAYEAAKATIRRRPGDFLWSSIVRVGRLWSPFPHDIQGRSTVIVLATGVFYLTLYAAVCVALVRHRRALFAPRWWAIWLLMITLTGVHAVYWSNLRMRSPAMPGLAIMAVFAAVPRKPAADQPPHS